MSELPPIPMVLIPLALLFVVWSVRRRARRVAFIRAYRFPPGLIERFGARHPQLDGRARHLVARGLRQFFLAYLKSGRKPVSMPSQVVDDLWHEHILHTRHYQQFCDRAFGRFLHHTPATALGPNRQNNSGLRRVWWHACREENIDPREPARLPLLFALDRQFNIPGGFRYALNCQALIDRDGASTGQPVHCAGDMTSTAFDGSSDGFGDSWFSGDGDGDGDGGGDGGGCGGD
ncbi:glycine-rich domain-containing protein [Thiocystis violacea]|uniref:glycine-rich domain-containing protein n=1 Tax=Thiocystis violacea TaxID=13725 RepID=UPI001907C0B2|nr:hypothetical protein [Thiocystis violacea]MBK1718334.1 hypothetical protein [Thiocystis violacea]